MAKLLTMDNYTAQSNCLLECESKNYNPFNNNLVIQVVQETPSTFI